MQNDEQAVSPSLGMRPQHQSGANQGRSQIHEQAGEQGENRDPGRVQSTHCTFYKLHDSRKVALILLVEHLRWSCSRVDTG